MALLPATTIGHTIAARIKAAAPAAGTPITDGDLQALWVGIMTDIYTDMAAKAVVTAAVVVASVSAVTPGVGVSGPGAGTATGTIS